MVVNPVLSVKEMRKIARDACIDMLGKDLVYMHKDLCCDFHSVGVADDGLFHYGLGMDTKETPFVFGSEDPMEYYAFVVVNPNTGAVTRDYEKSILP